MKNLRMYLSAFAVLAIVGSALAFNGKSLGNVWCFSGTPITNQACSNQNPAGTQLEVSTVSSGGSTTNPCVTGNPFIANGSQCQAPISGQEYLSE